MELRDWLREHYNEAQRIIAWQGTRSNVRFNELEDFVSRVILRALADPKPIRNPPAFLSSVAKYQALDDARHHYRTIETTSIDQNSPREHWDSHSGIELWEILGDLNIREKKSVIGKAMGFYDRELVDPGQTIDSVSKRRQRAKEKIRR